VGHLHDRYDDDDDDDDDHDNCSKRNVSNLVVAQIVTSPSLYNPL
jgi:hypothetical protein